MLPDGSINPGQMTSFNHYALGSIVDWLHRKVGGLAPLEPGYRRIEVAPLVGGGLTWAKSELRTPYGFARSAWRMEGGEFMLEVTIPAGSSARIVPPVGVEPFEVGSGEYRWAWASADLRLAAVASSE
jgi:alpha-L-rhamnosidase